VKFEALHKSLTPEKVIAAADRIERTLGDSLNGDKKAFQKMVVEDLVVLIQFARNKLKESVTAEVSR